MNSHATQQQTVSSPTAQPKSVVAPVSLKNTSTWPRSPWFYWATAVILYIFFIAASASTSPYANVSDENANLWQSFVNGAFRRTDDLLTITILSFVAGFAMAALSKIFDDTWLPEISTVWLPQITTTIEGGLDKIGRTIAKRVDDGKFGIILRTIKDNELADHEKNQVAKASLRSMFGDHSKIDDSYTNFLVDELLHKNLDDGGFVRHNFTSSVTIMRPDKDHPLHGQNVFIKKESQHFRLMNPNNKERYPLQLGTTWRISRDRLAAVLENEVHAMQLEYKVADKRIFDLPAIIAGRKDDILSGNEVGNDGIKLSYDGKWFNVRVACEIETRFAEAWIRYNTVDTIEEDDRVFVMAIRDPTYNFKNILQLGSGLGGWRIKAPLIGPALYNRSSRDNVIVDPVGGGSGSIDVTVPRWLMPGIVVSYEWAQGD